MNMPSATHPDEADKLMAFREKLSVPRFRQAEQGLVYHSLQEQVPLLEPGLVTPAACVAPLNRCFSYGCG